jgi:hypothetical protein
VTLFHAFQIVFAIVVLVFVVERVRALAFRGALDGAAFRRTLLALVREGRMADARDLTRASRPALAVEPVWALFDPAVAEDERPAQVEDRRIETEARVTRGLRFLRIAASIASALGFIGAAVEVHWIFHGEHGLRWLQPGLVESIGLWRAALSIAIGIATSSFALGSWVVLRKIARGLVADGRRILSSVEESLERLA